MTEQAQALGGLGALEREAEGEVGLGAGRGQPLARAAARASPASAAPRTGRPTLVSATDREPMRQVTWVTVDEVESGDWGIGGHCLTTQDVKDLQAGRTG